MNLLDTNPSRGCCCLPQAYTPPTPGIRNSFGRRQLLFELAPAVQLAHDLGDVHCVGCFSSFLFLFQLPQDDRAWAGAQMTPHKWEGGTTRKDRWVVGKKPKKHMACLLTLTCLTEVRARRSELGHAPSFCQWTSKRTFKTMSNLSSLPCMENGTIVSITATRFQVRP